MESETGSIPLEKLSPETQRLIKGLEKLKEKIEKISLFVAADTSENSPTCFRCPPYAQNYLENGASRDIIS